MSRHVLLFDIDGTLIRSGGAGLAALETALAGAFGFRGSTASVSLSGRTDHGIVADLLALAGVADTPDNRLRLLEAYLDALPAALHARPGMVLPGVVALLDALRERAHVAVGLLTGNVREGARVKLSHYGLAERFPFGGYGDQHADRDDVARAALEAAAGHLGTFDRDGIWVIGDTPFDVKCGRAIGARVIGVLTGWHGRAEMEACRPDLLLDDLSATERLLRLWE